MHPSVQNANASNMARLCREEATAALAPSIGSAGVGGGAAPEAPVLVLTDSNFTEAVGPGALLHDLEQLVQGENVGLPGIVAHAGR